MLLDRVALHDVTVLQSLAFDNVHGRIYTAQLISGNGAGLFVLDNSGPLEHTVERLLCCLDHGHSACA